MPRFWKRNNKKSGKIKNIGKYVSYRLVSEKNTFVTTQSYMHSLNDHTTVILHWN